jgi:hypothetical protein
LKAGGPEASLAAMDQPDRPGRWIARVLLRLVLLAGLAYGAGVVLNRTAARLSRSPERAGFSRGLLEGALMPCTLPTLLVGHDVTIYTESNSGLPYKRGYTLGVTLCGAVFFGLFYRRLRRLRGGA